MTSPLDPQSPPPRTARGRFHIHLVRILLAALVPVALGIKAAAGMQGQTLKEFLSRRT
jgi:hypothetical protein